MPDKSKLVLRILVGIITSPIWLGGGLAALLVFSPFVAIYLIVNAIEYAFTGKWDSDAR